MIQWPTQQQVPVDGHFNVYKDDGAGGAVAYAAALNPSPIAAWPEGAGKVGAGRGPAGYGPAGFGYGGVGAGIGPAGLGPAGFGAEMMSFTTAPLLDGPWTFAVVPFDAAGNPAAPSAGTTAQVTLAGTPDAPGRPTIDSYDAPAGTMQISFDLSDDDA